MLTMAFATRAVYATDCLAYLAADAALQKAEGAYQEAVKPAQSALTQAREDPPVALHRAATCIYRASRVIGSCYEYGVLLGVRNDAKGVCPACA